MRRYQFRLDKLLRLREHLEEVQRMETLQQEAVVRDAMNVRDNLFQEVTGTRQDLIPEQGVKWKAGEQHEKYRYLVRMIKETYLAEKDVVAKRDDLNRKRQALIERSREKKTLERLEVRTHEQWRGEMEHEEQIMLDEIGLIQNARRKQSGKILLKGILLLMCLGMSIGCYMVWKGWINNGNVGIPWLRLPFDQMAEKKVKQELSAYEEQQRKMREKRDKEQGELPVMEGVIEPPVEEEGFRNTVERIMQREEALRQKEESLESQESSLLAAQEDLKREINRLNNLQKRIGDELDQLRELEAKRKAEMSAERKTKMQELNMAVKAMTPKRAAELLFSVAFPSPQSVRPSPVPIGPDLEGMDLVVAVLSDMGSKDRGEILDAMTKTTPEKAAVIFDRLDNIRTGLEEDRFYEANGIDKKESVKAP